MLRFFFCPPPPVETGKQKTIVLKAVSPPAPCPLALPSSCSSPSGAELGDVVHLVAGGWCALAPSVLVSAPSVSPGPQSPVHNIASFPGSAK